MQQHDPVCETSVVSMSEPAADVAESADPSESEPGNDRLNRWINRTTLPLDLLALCTIWLTVVPFAVIDRASSHP